MLRALAVAAAMSAFGANFDSVELARNEAGPDKMPAAINSFPSLFLLNDQQAQEELRLSVRQKLLVDQLTADYLSGTLRNRVEIDRQAAVGSITPHERRQALESLQTRLVQGVCREAEGALTPGQKQRVREMQLQLKGISALLDIDVVRKLELTPEQQDQIRSIALEFGREGDRASKAVRSGEIPRENINDLFGDLQDRYLEKALEVLETEQMDRFIKLRGPKMTYRIYETKLRARVRARPQYDSGPSAKTP